MPKKSEITVVERLPVQLSSKQVELLNEETPPVMVKKVQKGGGMYSYVPIGYMIERLNKVFEHRWTFEVLREFEKEGHICVLGRLQVMLGEGLIIRKETFGGADIKRYSEKHKNAGKPLNLSNDYKAAASDALKKCASMLGVCKDVYHPILDELFKYEEQQQEQEGLEQSVPDILNRIALCDSNDALESLRPEVLKVMGKVGAETNSKMKQAWMQKKNEYKKDEPPQMFIDHSTDASIEKP